MIKIFVENDIASFEDFHDGDWFNKVYDLAKDTDIESLALELATHWWGSARAFVLPWLLVNGVYDSVYSVRSIPPDKSRQDLWDKYLQKDEFQGALWKLAESMYCSIYYAYENLIVNSLAKIKGASVRVTDRGLNKGLIEIYGDKFTNRIWNHSFIAVSREVRNCIVHNGGKSSKRLLKMRPLPHIQGEDILLSASDTRKLYNTLKPLAFEILQETLERLSAKAGGLTRASTRPRPRA